MNFNLVSSEIKRKKVGSLVSDFLSINALLSKEDKWILISSKPMGALLSNTTRSKRVLFGSGLLNPRPINP